MKAPGNGTEPAQRRREEANAGSRAARQSRSVATPWGAAAVVEEVSLPQRAGARRFALVAQVLDMRDGERLVRLAYSTDGVARRGPVTMRARDLERLRAALERAPVLREVLGM